MKPTLGQMQREFAICFARLIVWIYDQGWQVTFSEGYIGDSIDKASEDTPHKRTGNHFRKLAVDINLFINGVLISNGNHSAWRAIHRCWATLHPDAREVPGDANHIGLLYEGRV